ncbi:hypothetical protein [Arcicella aurantiaca]|uniref:hypothetical protein n=1 Tax=Arcicella aurantiaca TaxID=591202 RepID=UPI000D6C0557|nr:hypothetical protein [Arcicella aurantiaca]
MFNIQLPETISIAGKKLSGSEVGVLYFSKVPSTFEKFFQRIRLPQNLVELPESRKNFREVKKLIKHCTE